MQYTPTMPRKHKHLQLTSARVQKSNGLRWAQYFRGSTQSLTPLQVAELRMNTYSTTCLATTAGPRYGSAPGRLIIWRPLKTMFFFKLSRPWRGLANLLKGAYPNCRKTVGEIISRVETWIYHHHITDYSSEILAPTSASVPFPKWWQRVLLCYLAIRFIRHRLQRSHRLHNLWPWSEYTEVNVKLTPEQATKAHSGVNV